MLFWIFCLLAAFFFFLFCYKRFLLLPLPTKRSSDEGCQVGFPSIHLTVIIIIKFSAAPEVNNQKYFTGVFKELLFHTNVSPIA